MLFYTRNYDGVPTERRGKLCIVQLEENGLLAIQAVLEDEFALILMDIHIPEMDGITATKAIRNLPPPKYNILIVALTANAMTGDRETYLNAGMNDYVSKPIGPDDLSDAIRRQAGAILAFEHRARQSAKPMTDQITTREVDDVFADIDLDDA